MNITVDLAELESLLCVIYNRLPHYAKEDLFDTYGIDSPADIINRVEIK